MKTVENILGETVKQKSFQAPGPTTVPGAHRAPGPWAHGALGPGPGAHMGPYRPTLECLVLPALVVSGKLLPVPVIGGLTTSHLSYFIFYLKFTLGRKLSRISRT